jgi:hypothetical protein
MTKLDTAIQMLEDAGSAMTEGNAYMTASLRSILRLVKGGFISPEQGDTMHSEILLCLAKLGAVQEEMCSVYCELSEEQAIISMPVFSGPVPKEEL